MIKPKTTYGKVLLYDPEILEFLNNFGLDGDNVTFSEDDLLNDLDNIKRIEEEADFNINIIAHYVIAHFAIISLIPKSELENARDLLKSNDTNNLTIGTNILYNLIEDKKKQIRKLLKEDERTKEA